MTSTEPGHARGGRQRRSSETRRRRRIGWTIGIIAFVVLVGGAVAWLGVKGAAAYQELRAAQSAMVPLQAAVATADLTGLKSKVDSVYEHAAAARAELDDPVWRAAEFIPWLGTNLSAVRELTEVLTDGLAAAEPLVAELDGTQLSDFMPQDGALPLDRITQLSGLLGEFSVTFAPIAQRANELPTSGVIDQISDATTLVSTTFATLGETTAGAAHLGEYVPMLLGADGIRTLAVAFLNSAEVRPLGGTALAFAPVQFDSGRITQLGTVPAGMQQFPIYHTSVTPVPDGFEELYPLAYGRFVANATLRPDFPSAAAIIAANFEQARGLPVNEVLGMDASALQAIVAATGPVTLSTGDVVDASSVIPLLFNGVYQRYQVDQTTHFVDGNEVLVANTLQDLVYAETVDQVTARLMAGQFDPQVLIAGVVSSFAAGNLSYWSADPAVQSVIDELGWANSLPTDGAQNDAIGVYVSENLGSKLSYYLQQSIDIASATCATGVTTHRVTLDLNNTITPDQAASAGLFILGRNSVDGTQSVMIFGYAPAGSTIASASVNGEPVEIVAHHDTDRPVLKLVVPVAPEATGTVVVDIEVPFADHVATLDWTPLIMDTDVTTSTLPCG